MRLNEEEDEDGPFKKLMTKLTEAYRDIGYFQRFFSVGPAK